MALASIFIAQYWKIMLMIPIVSAILIFISYVVWNISWFVEPTHYPILPSVEGLYYVFLIIFFSMNLSLIHKFINRNKYISFPIMPVKTIYKYVLIVVIFLSAYILAVISAYMSTYLIYLVMYARELSFYDSSAYALDINFSLFSDTFTWKSDSVVISYLLVFMPSLYFVLTVSLKKLRNAIIFTSLPIMFFLWVFLFMDLGIYNYVVSISLMIFSVILYMSGYFILNKKQIK